uniref:Uncharacterized protein n=1 Tax=Ixodes ricinus TaxID=34613 RepID=A0A147BK82_IXORI
MISFSMAVWWFTKTGKGGNFGIGMPCSKAYPDKVTSACNSANDYRGSTKRPEHTRFGYHNFAGYAMTHDGPREIQFKICFATRTFTNISFGVAFFDMEYEDTTQSCKQSRYGHFAVAAGYWRVHFVADYFRKVVKQPDFMESGEVC